MPHCALLEHLESRTLKHLLVHSVFSNKQVHSKIISMLSSLHLTAHAYIQIQIKACWLNISSIGLNRHLNALTMHSRAWLLDVLPPIRKNLWKVWVISPFVGAWYHHPREPFFTVRSLLDLRAIQKVMVSFHFLCSWQGFKILKMKEMKQLKERVKISQHFHTFLMGFSSENLNNIVTSCFLLIVHVHYLLYNGPGKRHCIEVFHCQIHSQGQLSDNVSEIEQVHNSLLQAQYNS